MTQPTILITAFGPIGGDAVNPSLLIARRLDGETIAGARVEAVQLPCVFHRALTVLDEALVRTRPVLAGEGGSIPIVVEFERILGASALLIGYALPGNNAHAPNEWFPLENHEKGISSLIRLYQELGKR